MTSSNIYLPGTIQIPSALQIASATQAKPLVITVTVNPVTASNTYQMGQLVYFNVPRSYGMYQLNGMTGKILIVNSLTFTIDIDATGFDPFVIPASTAEQPASIAPSGSRNVQYNNFTNQAFRSLNDIGN